MQNNVLKSCSKGPITDMSTYGIEKKNELRFRLIFVGKEDENVEVQEVGKIDFNVVMERIESGQSLFISDMRSQ